MKVLGAGVKSSLSNDAPLTQIQTAVLLLHDVEDATQLSLDDHGDDEGTPDQLEVLDKGGAQVGLVHRSHGTQEPVAGVAVLGHHQQGAFEGHGRSTLAKAQSGHIHRRVERFHQVLKHAFEVAVARVALVGDHDPVPPILRHDPGVGRTTLSALVTAIDLAGISASLLIHGGLNTGRTRGRG